MNKVRIAVLCSGGGTNLQAILDSERAGKIPHGEVALVLSNNPNAYALERAKSFGIEAVAVGKKDFPDPDKREEEILHILQERKIELVVLAGFLTVLSEKFIRKYKDRIVNIHPSLIPSFCGKGFYGLRVHEAALAYGVKVTGATVHYVNEIPDGGKIISQKAVYIEEGDTPETLQKRVMREAEWVILPEAVETVCKKLRGE